MTQNQEDVISVTATVVVLAVVACLIVSLVLHFIAAG